MTDRIKILYIENDITIANRIKNILEKDSFSVNIAHDRMIEWSMFQNLEIDIILLGTDFLEKNEMIFFKQIRERKQTSPIVLYSSTLNDDNELIALESGIDLCIHKDCPIKLLIAKLKRMPIYKRKKREHNVYKLSPISVFQASSQILYVHGNPVKIENMEGRLLHLLCAKFHKVAELEYLKTGLWDKSTEGKDSSLRKYITRLRKLLVIDPSLVIINNRARGYCLTCL